MSIIEFPKPLSDLLAGSTLKAPIRALADRVGEILADNQLKFFPDYTDHGARHINAVLKSEIDLVPTEVWAASTPDSSPRLLCDADAAVLIGATLLHDLAMHLRERGFLELISQDSLFKPLDWFKESHEGHDADRPWHELWADYEREARRFSDRDLTNIIGQEAARAWKFDGLHPHEGQWQKNDYLIIGEFIRRHHARLAHEIAIYGFPGVKHGTDVGHFPAMGGVGQHTLKDLADLIGLVARSHGINLRVCMAYLKDSPIHARKPRPMGAAVHYSMALLRVADYLQLKTNRAPAVLLQLRQPQSPISLQEWAKHGAVIDIGPDDDPRAKRITATPTISLSLYLQLRELIDGLQREIDHSTAVLDEVYGVRKDLGLDQLGLTIRRVHSNLNDPRFREKLPYVPERTGFSADPRLLSLLVEPLYGKEPSIGVRELTQNAIDAVREFKEWQKHHTPIGARVALDNDADVLIEFVRVQEKKWMLRVIDRGIGMTAETIQNYFLRAGVSFRTSDAWAKDFRDQAGDSKVLRSGRFGIGAFAIFLLGSTFRVATRHAGTNESEGSSIEASEADTFIEIKRKNGLAIGTVIEVDLHEHAAWTAEAALSSIRLVEPTGSTVDAVNTHLDKFHWYCWDWPNVSIRIADGDHRWTYAPNEPLPIHDIQANPSAYPDCSTIKPPDFGSVYWWLLARPDRVPSHELPLTCNGIRIGAPSPSMTDKPDYELHRPSGFMPPFLAIEDPNAKLPLTLKRDQLSPRTLPFEQLLAEDMACSFIAFCLVCAPSDRESALLEHYPRYPLFADLFGRRSDGGILSAPVHRWCVTERDVAPVLPMALFHPARHTSVVIGVVHGHTGTSGGLDMLRSLVPVLNRVDLGSGIALTSWFFHSAHGKYPDPGGHAQLSGMASLGLSQTGASNARAWLAVLGGVAVPDIDLASFGNHPSTFRAQSLKIYKTISHAISKGRSYSLATLADRECPLDLWKIVDSIEQASTANAESQRPLTGTIFAAVVEPPTDLAALSPKDPNLVVARMWHECLGECAIPFDKGERDTLIQRALAQPRLGPHVTKWLALRDANSPLCHGDWPDTSPSEPRARVL